MIYTGGTIGMVKEYGSNVLKPFDFKNLLNHIPEIKFIDSEIDFLEFENPLDSSDIGISEWIKLAQMIESNYQKYDGFVILHGTDTMSYTASAMSFMLKGLKKPVIFTGSQLPIGELRTDSKENLITSLYYASLYQDNKPVLQEVCLYFEYKLYRGNRTTKFSAEHFDAFISPNFPNLGESGVNLEVNTHLLHYTNNFKKFKIENTLKNTIETFTFFPGNNLHFLENLTNETDIEVIILKTFGSGNIPTDKKTIDILKQIKKAGKSIVVLSQCTRGSVNIGKYKNSLVFDEINAISGYDITFESAVTKLMLLLGKKLKGEQLKTEFEKNYCGEMST